MTEYLERMKQLAGIPLSEAFDVPQDGPAAMNSAKESILAAVGRCLTDADVEPRNYGKVSKLKAGYAVTIEVSGPTDARDIVEQNAESIFGDDFLGIKVSTAAQQPGGWMGAGHGGEAKDVTTIRLVFTPHIASRYKLS